MGLCPKHGIAVACAGTNGESGLWTIGSLDEGRQLASQWLAAR